jgi:cytochrome c553
MRTMLHFAGRRIEQQMKTTLGAANAIALSILIGACTASSPTIPAVDPRATSEILRAQVCAPCHGVTGQSSTTGIPHLAAQQPEYLAAQLLAFRDRSRGGDAARTNMWPVAAQLSDAQIEGLAASFGRQPAAAGQPGPEELMSAGRRIYFEGIDGKAVPPCMMCHGLKGEGLGSFPRLVHQRKDYLLAQLRAFGRGGSRPESPMTLIAPKLSDDEQSAVATYLQGMTP